MPANPIPPIPALFLERMARLLGDEYKAFAAALEAQPVSGLRVNTLKLTPEEFQKISPIPLGERVEWCEAAFNLTPMLGASPDPSPNPADLPLRDASRERGFKRVWEPGKHPYHMAGLYYLQDPSAMAPAELLDPQPGERVLDLAAAPGGKTTALAARMQGRGLLVANEIKDKRVGHLAVNVERWGAGNVVITNENPERLADHFGPFFDRVLVDAPCSGEGMFRKDMGARRDWSEEMVAGCAIRQRNILRVAAKLVRPGGYLLYSTCTFAPEEDEQVISTLLDEFPEYEVWPLEGFPGFMRGRPDWTVINLSTKNTKYTKEEKKQENIKQNKEQELEELNKKQKAKETLRGAVRLFPQRVNGEGHFACMLKRSENAEGVSGWNPDRLESPSNVQERLWLAFAGEALKTGFEADRLRVRGERLYFIPENMPGFSNLRVVHPGVWLGTFKKERFEPAHPLALFLQPGQAQNVLELSSTEDEENNGRDQGGHRPPLRAYLGGESIAAEGRPGWTLVSVDGWPLGWGKRVQGVVKNHYPRGWQIY